MDLEPLKQHKEETPEPVASPKVSWFKDFVGIVVFIVVVAIGVAVVNALLLRTFSVVGPSMEDTLFTGERILVNRLPVTMSAIQGKEFIPKRGEIIVFTNPLYEKSQSSHDEYIVKRVIALPGERVTVDNCKVTVYNSEHPDGFDPYQDFDNLSNKNDCVSGEKIDYTIPERRIFVIGDHRNGNYSHDSRSGLGTNSSSPAGIPLEYIIGPVSMRITPINKISLF